MPHLLTKTLFAAALSIALAAPAHALEAKQRVEKEVTVTQDDGSIQTSLVPAASVTPGETVVYTVEFMNDSEAPATDLVLAMPVPADLQYLEGSAERAGAVARYSVDGGTKYAERDALLRPAVGGGTRRATSEEITHIQWTIPGPVAVGERDTVAFKARVK